MTKTETRKYVRERLLKISDAEREWASGAILDELTSLDVFKNAKSIFIFLGTQTEPDTEELIGLALAMEKTVSVPKISGDTMDAILISPFTDFRRNKYGILEPDKGQIVREFDLCILPLVAFCGLNRLGHGKGYYDKFLENNSCFKLGIAFDCQGVDSIETTSQDIPLDMLVTEGRVISACGVSSANTFGENL
ncbi:MAG: 5-formyltetrahydrofolate cyclo-ligase [Clostridia bacterium]